ncbi:MAG: LysE/ArgO family amino acid transporter [Rhizomicrobium sp.]
MGAALWHGFAVQLGLIVAIGPQNAFVLSQGLKRAHIFLICLICTLSDGLLIGLGVGGMATVMHTAPWLAGLLRYGGAAFLIWYALGRLRAACGPAAALDRTGDEVLSRRAAIAATLAFTWLNPHVYLDTVVMIGTLASQFPGDHGAFGLGAALASALFFFSLGYGARLLAPLLARPTAWRVLDLVIFGTMVWVAGGLLLFR